MISKEFLIWKTKYLFEMKAFLQKKFVEFEKLSLRERELEMLMINHLNIIIKILIWVSEASRQKRVFFLKTKKPTPALILGLFWSRKEPYNEEDHNGKVFQQQIPRLT